MKKIIALVVLLGVVVGGAYGLARLGVIPVKKMAGKSPAMRSLLAHIGLGSPALPALRRAAKTTLAPDPLAAEKRSLDTQRAALQQERDAWESERLAQQKSAAQAKTAAQSAVPDPKQLTRLAAVYEEMAPDAVNRIFSKLPDGQVIALLRRMDEQQVGVILAASAPDRAARITLTLSRPDPMQAQAAN